LQSNLKADLFWADDSLSRGPLCGQGDEKHRETGLSSHNLDLAGGVEVHLPVAFGLRKGPHREPVAALADLKNLTLSGLPGTW
jgi:hypothetical protein